MGNVDEGQSENVEQIVDGLQRIRDASEKREQGLDKAADKVQDRLEIGIHDVGSRGWRDG